LSQLALILRKNFPSFSTSTNRSESRDWITALVAGWHTDLRAPAAALSSND
jgi:hypothetical protein